VVPRRPYSSAKACQYRAGSGDQDGYPGGGPLRLLLLQRDRQLQHPGAGPRLHVPAARHQGIKAAGPPVPDPPIQAIACHPRIVKIFQAAYDMMILGDDRRSAEVYVARLSVKLVPQMSSFVKIPDLLERVSQQYIASSYLSH
jgi:hypothetical protein